MYVYRHKHNYILCSMFTITKAQLHVSTISVGHLQVVHDELINKLYQRLWGIYSLWGGVGATQNEISHPSHPTNCKLPTHVGIAY